MNVDEILIAHEFLDEAGDLARAPTWRGTRKAVAAEGARLLHRQPEHRDRRLRSGRRPTRSTIKRDAPLLRHARRRKLRGFRDHGDKELKQLVDLPYAILNKTRLSYVYDFN